MVVFVVSVVGVVAVVVFAVVVVIAFSNFFVFRCNGDNIKGATSRFVHLEKFSLNLSSSSFATRVDLLRP